MFEILISAQLQQNFERHASTLFTTIIRETNRARFYISILTTISFLQRFFVVGSLSYFYQLNSFSCKYLVKNLVFTKYNNPY